MSEYVSQTEFDLWKKSIVGLFDEFNEVIKYLELEQEETNGPEFNPVMEELREELSILKDNYPKILEKLTDVQRKLTSMKENRTWTFRGKQDDLIRFISVEYYDNDKAYIDIPLETVRYLMTKDPGANIDLDTVDKDVDNNQLPQDLIRAIETSKIDGIEKLKANLDIREEKKKSESKEEKVNGESLDSEDEAILKFLEKNGTTKTGEIQTALKMGSVVFINKVEKLKRLGKVEETEKDTLNYLKLTRNQD